MSYDPDKLRQSLMGSNEDEKSDKGEDEPSLPDKEIDTQHEPVSPKEPDLEEPLKETEVMEPIDKPEVKDLPRSGIRLGRPTELDKDETDSKDPPASSSDHQTRPDLENVPADEFAPLREALVNRSTDSRSIRIEQESLDGQDRIESSKKTGSKDKKKPKQIPRGKPKPIVVRPPAPLTLLMLAGGVISLVVAAIGVAGRELTTPVLALGGIGIVLISAFVSLNMRWIRTSLSGRSVRYGTNVLIAVLSLAGILVLINFISYSYHYRLDLSSEGLHSLSQQTLSVLEDVNRAGETISVMAFAPPGSGYRREIEELLDLYMYHSRNFEFTMVDPDIQRNLAEEKEITRYPSVLFELGENRSVIIDIDEPHFTSAILAVRQTRSRLVSFLTGHGEPDPFSEDRIESGLSTFRNQLEIEGYDVRTLSIPVANGIPAETSILVIAAPERDLEQLELIAIENYLDNGGNLMCFLEPGEDAGLEDLLSDYGFILPNGIVLDDEHNTYGKPETPVVYGNPEHPITETLSGEGGMVFVNAGSLEFTSSRLPDVDIENLVKSSTSSWLETSDMFTFNEGLDTRDSYEMAALATRILDVSEPVDPEPVGESNLPDELFEEAEVTTGEDMPEVTDIAQVFVVTDASFIQNANIDRFYNKDLAMNAVNYLASRHDLISVRPSMVKERPLEINDLQRRIIFTISVVLIPLLVAAVGGLVWWKRW